MTLLAEPVYTWREPRFEPAPAEHSRPGALEWLDRHRAVIYLLLIAASATLFFVNLDRAPDFTIDDSFYTQAGQYVVNHNSISWSQFPILVHPPLFFLLTGGWLWLFGDAHASTLVAEHTARQLNAVLDVAQVVVVVSMTRALSPRPGRSRALAMIIVGLLVALDPFLLKFGRSVLIEPLAVLAGLAVVRLAFAWRSRSNEFYVPSVGIAIGLALLCKEPVIFAAATPLVAAVLRQNLREIARDLKALAVGLFVLVGAWAFACAFEGNLGPLWHQNTFSLQRLLGIVQDTGLNRGKISPLAAFEQSFWQYSAGYVLLLAGGVALLAALWRYRYSLRHNPQMAWLLAFGLTSDIFVLYSMLVGAANQQLTVYGVPASAMLIMLAWDPLRYRNQLGETHRESGPLPLMLRAGAAALALGLGVMSWFAYMGFDRDDYATATVESFISHSVPLCAPVNATGDNFRWISTLRTNPVTTFLTGPSGIASGVHVWLLSPKDSKFYYGVSSPALQAWVKSHGHEVYSVKSTSFEDLQVWYVGTPVTPKGATAPSCATPIPPASTNASATTFLMCLAGALGITAGAGMLNATVIRRRRVVLP